MSERELKFDIEKINQVITGLEELAEDLRRKKGEVVQALGDLKQYWNTSAGRSFMKNVDLDWTAEVERYVQYVGAVKSLLEEASIQYSHVQEAVESFGDYRQSG